MTAFSAAGVFVPAPRAAAPQIPTQRRPVDTAPEQHPGRHRIAETVRTPRLVPSQQRARAARTAPARTATVVTLAARAGSIVTLAAMLVAAAAAAGVTDGVAPTGDAATVASSTLR